MTLPAPTPEQKRAVWNAIAPPAQLNVDGIIAATGLSDRIVWEVIALGRAAGQIEIHDADRQAVWISRSEVAA
ncbi:hypothetical protein DRW48_10370 [Paracoccus suum]|uniref:Uncharacterized protein n=1 Tax=Paracoccus suum TaxID=2259340 RepID=A0A344PKY6_9RHOB|nr:hypothetical protein [Paracoccus suum]AXC50041.1 hypothetical protein DRW48_10370 [Paracoccus suum]